MKVSGPSGPDWREWRHHPDRDYRLDMAILIGDDFDVYLELVDREIHLDINERIEGLNQCGRWHLPDDPCRPEHPG